MKCKDIPVQSYGVIKTFVKFVSRALHDFWANFLNDIFPKISTDIKKHSLSAINATFR